jgi:hypothetical protein
MRLGSALGSIVLGLATLAATGCYRGAIYASYQEAGLGIKATAESNSPIKVHFGYDRGAGAWVPRRGGADEEATSLISRDDVRANANPMRLADGPLLQASGVAITGTAAIVASSPSDAQVTVVEADSVLEVQTKGTAGERIATALSPVAFSNDQYVQRTLIIETIKRKDGDAVFRAAAAKMSDRFQTLFQNRLDSQDTVSVAFQRATFTYTNEVDDSRARVAEMVAALRAAGGK